MPAGIMNLIESASGSGIMRCARGEINEKGGKGE